MGISREVLEIFQRLRSDSMLIAASSMLEL